MSFGICFTHQHIFSFFFSSGEECKGVSRSSSHSAVCPEWLNEHSIQLSRWCKSHLRRQTAQGFTSRSGALTCLLLTLWLSEVLKMCSEFAADRFCPGRRVERKRESTHGWADPENRNYSLGCYLQQVWIVCTIYLSCFTCLKPDTSFSMSPTSGTSDRCFWNWWSCDRVIGVVSATL